MANPEGYGPYEPNRPEDTRSYPPPGLPAPYPAGPYPAGPYPPGPYPGAYQQAPYQQPTSGYLGGAAPFGVDPVTGRAYSDKSKVAAGLLQLLLGFFFCLGGVGRLYAGNTALGVGQLITTAVAWVSFFCGFALVLPWLLFAGAWLWFVVDGIVLLAGRPVDGQGRPLRA